MTAAGRVFLDHARLALAQVDAAGEAARRAAQPAKPSFAPGFLTGKEIDRLPEAIRLLRDELPKIEITVSSQYSPDLADTLVKGKLATHVDDPRGGYVPVARANGSRSRSSGSGGRHGSGARNLAA